MSYSSKLSVQRRGSWEPQYITSWSEVQVTMWTCNWHLKWRQSCGTEPLTCGIWCYFQVDGVRIMFNLWDLQSGSTENWRVGWSYWKTFQSEMLCFHFFFFAMLCVMWDLSSPTRDQTCAPCIGRVESEPPDGQWNSSIAIFYCHRLDGGNTTGLAVKGQGCC